MIPGTQHGNRLLERGPARIASGQPVEGFEQRRQQDVKGDQVRVIASGDQAVERDVMDVVQNFRRVQTARVL